MKDSVLFSITTLLAGKILKFLLPACLFLAPLFTAAQALVNSPYSRFGMGTIWSNNSMVNMAMGGSSQAFRSQYYLNPLNPASYTAIDSNSFTFEGAVFGRIATLHSANQSVSDNYASLGYLYMGFPVTRWWKTSIGLLPYSNVGYTIQDKKVLDGIGLVHFDYTGNGGVNKLFIGNGIKLGKYVSAGFNVAYLFGTIDKQRSSSFPDSSYHFNARITNSDRLHNFYADFGLQYHYKGASGNFFNTGITFSPSQSLKVVQDLLAISYVHDYSNNLDITKDTIDFNPNHKGTVTLPLGIGGGLSFGRTDRWLASADFQWQNWNEFRYFGTTDNLKNSFRVSVGGQVRPNPMDMGKYWKRIQYRAGARYEQSYLELYNSQLHEFGISFGVGLPMRKGSTLNLAIETGSFGTTVSGLIKENFVKFTVGTCIQERWFLKTKYK